MEEDVITHDDAIAIYCDMITALATCEATEHDPVEAARLIRHCQKAI